jgi:hypothetical protein
MKLLRLSKEELELLTAGTRFHEDSLKIFHLLFVKGKGISAISEQLGVSRQHVSALGNSLRKIHGQKKCQFGIAEVTVSVPVTLATEIEGLSTALLKEKDLGEREKMVSLATKTINKLAVGK